MHWFWITFSLYQLDYVAFGHSLLTTLHSIPATTDLVPTNLGNSSETNATIRNETLIPPKTYSPLVLRNASSYSKLASVPKHLNFSNKLDVIPLEVPLKHNASKLNNTTNRDFTVINQTFTDPNINVTVTGYISSTNTSINVSNHSDNVTYLGEELNYNHSLIQSERIGIEQDLDIEEINGNLSAAGITGITVGCIVIVGMICGISFFIYHNQGFNRPQVLNDRCSNPDSSGYIDDASVRDNSEEMYSLDNDSFLNSLEAMTIQNYWTDTVKHTKL